MAVFSLGRWSALLPAGFLVSGGTHDPSSHQHPGIGVRDSHPLRWPVPVAFRSPCVLVRGVDCPLHDARPTLIRQRQSARTPHKFGLLPVRSPLLRESSLLLAVLRCFTSRGSLPDLPGDGPCAHRVAPFGSPGISGCQRLPQAFRRVAASFLGRHRQGIHPAPVFRTSLSSIGPLCARSRHAR
jgi:hypothetical protein